MAKYEPKHKDRVKIKGRGSRVWRVLSIGDHAALVATETTKDYERTYAPLSDLKPVKGGQKEEDDDGPELPEWAVTYIPSDARKDERVTITVLGESEDEARTAANATAKVDEIISVEMIG